MPTKPKMEDVTPSEEANPARELHQSVDGAIGASLSHKTKLKPSLTMIGRGEIMKRWQKLFNDVM
jgi:hypothetical protein